jgi:hypothetical protein
MHKHTWIVSRRKHRRPPRIFVQCKDPACGITRQAVMNNGYAHVFHTGRTGVTPPMRNYSIRLPRKPTKEEVKFFQAYLRKNPAEE